MRRTSPVSLIVLAALGLSGCQAWLWPSANVLELSEHQLVAAPELEPLSFQPVQGNRDAILAEHASDRAAVMLQNVATIDGNPVMTSLGDNGELRAVLTTAAQGTPEQRVTVLRGGTTIFEAAAGLPSPALPLQGLWTYGGHWALELLISDPPTWGGEVFIDGQLVNKLKGYDEAFGLQLLAGRPFFFYLRDGHVGYSFDGKETALEYTEVVHYRCCAESVLNPIQARNMVAFFARRDPTWFYVELGAFSQ